MDYEGFVRSILLPQGQFQQFLAGKPEERRKVLDGLLRLDIYESMQKRANEIAREHGSRTESLQQALDQYEGATPEALEAARSKLSGLQRQAKELGTRRDAISEANKTAVTLATAVAKREQAEKAAANAGAELKRAEKLLESGQQSVAAMTKELASIDKKIEDNSYDADLSTRLSQALDLVQRVEKSEKRLAEWKNRAKKAGPLLDQLKKQAAEAASAAEAARKAVESAEEHLQNARRDDLAATVRHGLKPGDPCPVCGQKIASLPEGEHAGIAGAEATLKQAQEATTEAGKVVQSLDTDTAVAERDAESLHGQIAELHEDCSSDRSKLSELLGGEEAVAADIAAAVRAQTKARGEREVLVTDERTTRKKLDDLKAEMATANQNLAGQRAEIQLREKETKSYGAEIEAARSALVEAAKRESWSDVIERMDAGNDPSPLLGRHLEGAEVQLTAVNQQIGGTDAETKRVEEGIAKAKDIREEMEKAREAGTLARDLASLLRVTAFPNYIREQALKVLAQDGSRHLLEISCGRYEFRVAGQEFMVADGWNLGEARSVRTLSGGETFLASLALALALAERLPTLGAAERAGTLETLLIDEGFSNLDVSTLDDVVNAIEIIGKDRTRMVGIVTHLDELAQRMPARIKVHKDQSNSTVTVE
jgi:exonuclease SbcC